MTRVLLLHNNFPRADPTVRVRCPKPTLKAPVAFPPPTRHTGKVITLTEPQLWTIIGVFAATLLGTMTLLSTVLMRSISGQITSLRNEMMTGFGGFANLRAEMNARFETVNVRLDNLDRDVQALSERVFRTDRP